MAAGCFSEGLNKKIPPHLACLNSLGIKIQHINYCFNISLKQISMCARSDKNHLLIFNLVNEQKITADMTFSIAVRPPP
jgi:hypothetical protein